MRACRNGRLHWRLVGFLLSVRHLSLRYTSGEQNMRSLPQLIMVYALWIILVLGCVSTENQSNSNQTPPPKSSVFFGYEKLTHESTYNDVIEAMGPPDAEVSSGPPEAKVPNMWMAYRKCSCMVFLIYKKMPKKGIFL